MSGAAAAEGLHESRRSSSTRGAATQGLPVRQTGAPGGISGVGIATGRGEVVIR